MTVPPDQPIIPSRGHDQPEGSAVPTGDGIAPGGEHRDPVRPDPDDESHQAALAGNLAKVRSDIAAAARAEGQPEPELIAVTKSVPSEVAMALHRLGCEHLAENRAPMFLEKVAAFSEAGLEPTWHFIGHIQRNKARRILERAHVLHSVDSIRLAKAVARILGELGRSVDLFLEVNLTGEAEKHGLSPSEVPAAIEALGHEPNARLLGIMAMGPLQERGTRSTDEVFADAQRLAAEIEGSHRDSFVDGTCKLSMGMSGDLEPAIRRGSTHVRIGSSLFRSIAPAAPKAPAPPSQ